MKYFQIKDKSNFINEFYDKGFVINLDRRPDRFKIVNKELNRLNIKYYKMSAFDGNDEKNIDYIKNNFKVQNLLKGEIGCIMSHLNIYAHIFRKKYNNCLIMEDDISFNKGICQKMFYNIMNEINFNKTEPYIIYFNTTGKWLTSKSDNKKYSYDGFGLSTGCYCINYQFAKIILKEFKKGKEFNMPIDLFIIKCIKKYNIKSCIAKSINNNNMNFNSHGICYHNDVVKSDICWKTIDKSKLIFPEKERYFDYMKDFYNLVK